MNTRNLLSLLVTIATASNTSASSKVGELARVGFEKPCFEFVVDSPDYMVSRYIKEIYFVDKDTLDGSGPLTGAKARASYSTMDNCKFGVSPWTEGSGFSFKKSPTEENTWLMDSGKPVSVILVKKDSKIVELRFVSEAGSEAFPLQERQD